MTAPAPILRLDAVAYAFEATRLRFDLSAQAGEWLAVLGPSGAGKSTLLDLVAGFLEPNRGRITIGGAEMRGVPPGRRPVSVVFQENNLFPHLSAERNVALGIAPGIFAGRAARAAAREALEAVGLAGLEARRPSEMSGGERQRVALARAFVRRRSLLLLDEPFAALGPALALEMLQLLQALRQRTGVTIVMVTHRPEDARLFADRVAFVDGGEIAALGPTGSLLGSDPPPAVRRYLGGESG